MFDIHALLLVLQAHGVLVLLIAVSLSNIALLLVNVSWARRIARRYRRMRLAEQRLNAGPLTRALMMHYADETRAPQEYIP